MDDPRTAEGGVARRAQQIELLLQQVETIPTLSPVATRLLTIGSRDDAEMDEIAALIESDPALTARILGLCRSAYMGIRADVKTVRHAVVMLGLDALQAMVLSVAVYDLMNNARPELDVELAGESHEQLFDHIGFWRHSVGVASCASLIAEEHPELGVSPGEGFVAGLLHGLGKLVLDLLLPGAYARVLALASRRSEPTAPQERALFGLDHYTVGKRVAERWSLPAPLQDVLWLHAQPWASLPDLGHKPLIGVVSIAKLICRHMHVGWCGDHDQPSSIEEACQETGIDPRRIADLSPRIHPTVAERCQVLGLEAEGSAALLLGSLSSANDKLSRMYAQLRHSTRHGAQQVRTLDAIGAFHASHRPGKGLIETFAQVVRSASELLGRGYYAVLYQSATGQPWQVCQFSSSGRLMRSQLVDAPHDVGSLASLADPSELRMGSVAMLPWISDFLNDATDVRRVGLLALTLDERGPGTVLLHDRALADAGMSRHQIEALTATWAAAIEAASEHEKARRLSEQLAESNRSLTETRARLAEAEALAKLGEMTAGAAHEMNNPLTVISGRSQILAQRLEDDRDRAAAAAIVSAAEDLTNLITSLHLIADPPAARAQAVAVGDLVEKACERARMHTGSTSEITVSNDGAADVVRLDPELAASALSEVIVNAIEAHPASISIRIHTDPSDGRLLITVEDDGSGMSARSLQHAFDPFFSEKPAGRQTGLGLTRARRLVEVQGGEIALRRTPDGTVACLAFPENRIDVGERAA